MADITAKFRILEVRQTLLIEATLLRQKLFTLNQRLHKFTHVIIFTFGLADNLLYQGIIGEAIGATESVLDQHFGEAAREVFLLPFGDQFP